MWPKKTLLPVWPRDNKKLDTPVSDISLMNMFSHSVGCLFTLLMVSFAVKNFLVCYSPICLFFLVSLAQDDISEKILRWSSFIFCTYLVLLDLLVQFFQHY